MIESMEEQSLRSRESPGDEAVGRTTLSMAGGASQSGEPASGPPLKLVLYKCNRSDVMTDLPDTYFFLRKRVSRDQLCAAVVSHRRFRTTSVCLR